MKYALALLLLCSQLTGFAQKDSLTLYAYEQKVSPGIAPAKTSQAKTQYYIYLSFPHNLNVYPVFIWIKGKQFGVNAKEVKTPVKKLASNGSTIILVPETAQKLLRLFPLVAKPNKEQKGAALAKQNEIVLVYKSRGRFHYLIEKSINQLDAINMQ